MNTVESANIITFGLWKASGVETLYQYVTEINVTMAVEEISTTVDFDEVIDVAVMLEDL